MGGLYRNIKCQGVANWRYPGVCNISIKDSSFPFPFLGLSLSLSLGEEELLDYQSPLRNVEVAAHERRFTKLHIAEAAEGARLLTNVNIGEGRCGW